MGLFLNLGLLGKLEGEREILPRTVDIYDDLFITVELYFFKDKDRTTRYPLRRQREYPAPDGPPP